MPVTNKPIEVRMGKGKGSVSYFVAPVKSGFTTIYEIGGIPKEMAIQALKSGSVKLPIDTRVICKSN